MTKDKMIKTLDRMDKAFDGYRSLVKPADDLYAAADEIQYYIDANIELRQMILQG